MENLIAKRQKEFVKTQKNALRAAAILAAVMSVIIAVTLWSFL